MIAHPASMCAIILICREECCAPFQGLDRNSTRSIKPQFTGSPGSHCLIFQLKIKIDTGRHELFCNSHRQAGAIRSGNSADGGFRASCRDRAGARYRVRHLGRAVRGGTWVPDGNSSSRRTGDDRVRSFGHLRNSLGRTRRIGRACKGRRFYSCPRFPAAHGNQSFKSGAISMGCCAEHRNAHRRQSP
jgi:hypothetical protein